MKRFEVMRLLGVCSIIFIFVFLRLFQLPQNFNLFGDLGRDLWTLQKWQQTWIPPLLGPQTSVVSFNQSAWYFYLLFPFYILLGHSPFSTVVAAIGIYIISWLAGLWFFRSDKLIRDALFAAGFLIAIHPLFIFHHRYVWNPSLVTPFLIAALIGLIKLFQENRPRWIWLIATGLSLAVSLSYSVAPQALLIFGMAMFKAKNKKLMLLAQVSTAVFFNLPTLFFELRHNFLLTKSVLYPEYLQGDSLGWNRVYLLFTHLISPRHPELIGGLSLALLVLCLVSWGIHRKYPPQNQMRSASFTLMLVLFWASVVITSVIPLTLHEHYMFGLATLLVMTLAFLPWQVLVPTLGVICILWMTPFYWQLYTKAPLHTVAEKQNCMAQVCQQIAGPVFINTHSSSHNHQALEYIFLLKEAGCTALSTTEFQPSSASQMVVVADNAEYTHGQTGYYELSQFGGGTQTKVVECKPNLKAYFIAK